MRENDPKDSSCMFMMVRFFDSFPETLFVERKLGSSVGTLISPPNLETDRGILGEYSHSQKILAQAYEASSINQKFVKFSRTQDRAVSTTPKT